MLLRQLLFVRIKRAGAGLPKITDVLHRDLLGEMGLCEDEQTKFSPTFQSSDFFHCSRLGVFEEAGNVSVIKC